MIFSYANLKGRIVTKYGTQQRFAEVLGISTVSMSKKLGCKTGFSQDDIITWCDKLDIPLDKAGEYFFA